AETARGREARARQQAVENAHQAQEQKRLALASAELANRAQTRERKQRLVAERLLYDADMNVAYNDWNTSELGRALGLLEEHRPAPGEEDSREFEWFYLWRLCHGD